jgi:hypothetical protein
MKNVLGTVLLSSVLLTPSALAVTQKFNFDLNATHMKGQETLHLKRMVSKKYGRQSLQGFKLKKVMISAKSKKGQADANLQVGYKESYPKTIEGTPQSFDSNHSGFHSLSFVAPNSRQGQSGPWKLHIKGNVKVDSVNMAAKMKLDYNPQNVAALTFKAKDSMKVDKIVGSTKTIKVGPKFKAIQFKASGKSVSITSVKVKFTDGQQVILDELEGKVKGVKSFKFKHQLNKPIKHIKVSAVSNNLFGSRGKLHISTAKAQGAGHDRGQRPGRGQRRH